MKMTAEEILAMYNKDRSRENMQKIADLNGCTMHDIGEFLKAAADTPKKKEALEGLKSLVAIRRKATRNQTREIKLKRYQKKSALRSI